MPAVDRYRADGGAATGDVYDARLFREEVFVPLLAETGTGRWPPTARSRSRGWAVADPDGKLATAVAKRLGAPAGCRRRSTRALGRHRRGRRPLLGLVQACAGDDVGAPPA